MSRPSFSILVTATGEQWEATLPFLLASLANQKYNTELVEVIITGDADQLGGWRERFPSLKLRFLSPQIEGHAPMRHRLAAWQAAQHEVILSLDADVVLLPHILNHLAEIISYDPLAVVLAADRLPLQLDSLPPEPNAAAETLGYKDYALAGKRGPALISTVHARHPGTGASFLLAVRRDQLQEDDFCLEYDGRWGVEDNDFVYTLARRGLHPVSQPEIVVWHWQHPSQSDQDYQSQLDIFYRRFGDELILNQTEYSAVVWEHLSPRGNTQIELALHGIDLRYPTSVTTLAASFFFALWATAWRDHRAGGPYLVDWPALTPLSPLRHDVMRMAATTEPAWQDSGQTAPFHLWFIWSDRPVNLPTSHTGGYHIGYLNLEGAVVGGRTLSIINHFAEIWVPNELSRQALTEAGVTQPIRVIPLGTFSLLYYPHDFPRLNKTKYRFLAVGVGPRKQPYELLRTFVAVFQPTEAVELVIVNYHHGRDLVQEVRERWPAWQSQIVIKSVAVPAQELVSLYQSSDAIVSCSQGEAWQLPLLDAAACGALVISPRGNGIDYLNDENAVLYEARSIRSNAAGGWVEPDLASLGQTLRAVYEHPEQYAERRGQLFRQAHTEYHWFKAAEQIWRRLSELSGILASKD